MQASECCIVRVAIAAVLGGLVAFALLWQHSAAAALLLSPVFGSTAAVAAVTLFWVASLFIPCPAAPERTVGVAR